MFPPAEVRGQLRPPTAGRERPRHRVPHCHSRCLRTRPCSASQQTPQAAARPTGALLQALPRRTDDLARARCGVLGPDTSRHPRPRSGVRGGCLRVRCAQVREHEEVGQSQQSTRQPRPSLQATASEGSRFNLCRRDCDLDPEHESPDPNRPDGEQAPVDKRFRDEEDGSDACGSCGP
jgi:hypothetical protein